MPELQPWEVDALTACRVGSEVRGNMIVLWILLVLNTIVSVFMVTSRGPSDSLGVFWIINLLGFVVAGVLSGITYWRGSHAWVLATSLSLFVFACNCLTIAMAIAMLANLGTIQAIGSTFPLTYPEWKATKDRVKAIYKTSSPEWTAWHQWPHKIRLKFFSNAAVFLLGPSGAAVVIDKAEAAGCQLQATRQGQYELTGWMPKGKKVTVKKLRLNSATANSWHQWSRRIA